MTDLFGEEIAEKEIKGSRKIFACLGASNHVKEERQAEDFYATSPESVKALLKVEKFSDTILEPCVGMGHIAEVLKQGGHNVIAQDIVNRGYENTIIRDFLNQDVNYNDIVTNPPYVMAKDFAEHALNISPNGTKIAMFLKLTFLESQSRKELFEKYPFRKLYVFSQRQICAKNGDFANISSSAVAYGWYIWEKGFTGEPVIKWI